MLAHGSEGRGLRAEYALCSLPSALSGRYVMSIRVLIGGVLLCSAVLYGQSGSTVTPDDYKRWRTELRNWGRWGPNDQKGTANLITPEKVQSAARLVRSGIVVSLAGAVPQQEAADVGPNTTTDTYQVSYHGLSLGHTDAFCHFFMDGQMYNGYSVKETITPETGCKQGSIMGRRDGIVTRGVLYDMPQMKGVDWIEPGTPITRADLEAWEKRSGVRVGDRKSTRLNSSHSQISYAVFCLKKKKKKKK